MDAIRFSLLDRPGRLARVTLQQEIGLSGPVELARERGTWTLEIPADRVADVDRLEYLFEVEDHNGRRATITDPTNPLRAPGAFGEKSVLELPGYRSPAWLGADAVAGTEQTVEVDAPTLDDPVAVTVWSPSDLALDDAAPLVVAHDGPEYAALGGLTEYLATQIAAGALPPLRAALLGPGDRNVWYAANDGYADAVAGPVLAGLDRVAPATVRVGVGVSLGALAMLHLHRRHPGLLDALLLQSGSFFTGELDPQEAGFSGFAAITAFTAALHDDDVVDVSPVPATVACGLPEENLANNRRTADILRRQGHPTRFVEVRDAHNYTAWRDTLDPHLGDLVRQVVRDAA